jgi:hypothetical protein
MLTIKNTCPVKLEVMGITVDESDAKVCSVKRANALCGGGRDLRWKENEDDAQEDDASALVGNEEEKLQKKSSLVISSGESATMLFHVRPLEASPSLHVGSVNVKWRRVCREGGSSSEELKRIVSKAISIPKVHVEEPALLTTFNCPTGATVGVPFDVSLCVENRTGLAQEVSFSVQDSPAFILSGAHNDTLHILPYAKDVISYRLVSIASGLQQLPQVSLTATRYSAAFQQQLSSIQMFVFPPGMGERLTLDVPFH